MLQLEEELEEDNHSISLSNLTHRYQASMMSDLEKIFIDKINTEQLQEFKTLLLNQLWIWLLYIPSLTSQHFRIIRARKAVQLDEYEQAQDEMFEGIESTGEVVSAWPYVIDLTMATLYFTF